MGNLFSKPKTPKIPPPPDPEAIPEIEPEAGDVEARKARLRRGFRSSIITGDLAPGAAGKKAVLG